MRTRAREPRPAPRKTRPPEPTVAAIVREQTGVAWSRARDLCAEWRVTLNGERCLDPALRVSPGAVVVVDERAPKLRTGALPESAIVFLDRDVVVVDKPAGMLSIAYEPGDKDTLVDRTRIFLRRMGGRGFLPQLGVVHRLDKETSGLMVFARTLGAKRILADQFRAHDIERVYHAIAHGAVAAKRVETHLIADRGDGIRGSYGHFRRPEVEFRPRRSVRLLTSHRSLRSRVRPWSSAASKPGGSIRFASTCPNSAIPWSANACISATTQVQRSNRRARCSTREFSDSHIPERASACRSSAKHPTTSGR